MEKAAVGLFGSGWAWLAEDKSGKLVSVPKDKLEAFAKAQSSGKELTPEEKERRVQEISQKLGMK